MDRGCYSTLLLDPRALLFPEDSLSPFVDNTIISPRESTATSFCKLQEIFCTYRSKYTCTFIYIISSQMVLVCPGCPNKMPQTECLKQQLWKLEVYDQGVIRFGSSLRFLSLTFRWLGCLLTLSPYDHPSVCLYCLCSNLCCKDTHHIGLGSPI